LNLCQWQWPQCLHRCAARRAPEAARAVAASTVALLAALQTNGKTLAARGAADQLRPDGPAQIGDGCSHDRAPPSAAARQQNVASACSIPSPVSQECAWNPAYIALRAASWLHEVWPHSHVGSEADHSPACSSLMAQEHRQGGQPHHNQQYCSILAQLMIVQDGDGPVMVHLTH
jgi:hypothetical protein